MNKVFLIGNLTGDPEVRTTQSGLPMCRFSLAVSRRFATAEGNRETDFINIVVWRQQGENCAQYLSKGKLAAVDGSLHLRSYTGNDGIKRTAAEVVADTVRFLSPKEGGSNYSQAAPIKEVAPYNDEQDEEMVGDDDLPF